MASYLEGSGFPCIHAGRTEAAGVVGKAREINSMARHFWRPKKIPGKELLRVHGEYGKDGALECLAFRRFGVIYRVKGVGTEYLTITADGKPLGAYRMDAVLRELIEVMMRPRQMEGVADSREWNLVPLTVPLDEKKKKSEK